MNTSAKKYIALAIVVLIIILAMVMLGGIDGSGVGDHGHTH